MATTIQIDGDQITLNDAASEETLKELVDLLKRQSMTSPGSTSTNNQQKKTAEDMSKAAKGLKNASVDLGKVVETFDDIETKTNATFASVGAKITKELQTVAKNTGNVISDLVRGPASFETLGRALQAGSAQAGELMEEFAQGAAGAIPGVGAFGTALKAGTAVLGAAGMAVAAYAQNMTDGFVALSQSGANYNGDIVKTASEINGLGLTMNAFTQIVQQNAAGLASYGGSVTNGARQFVELTNVMRNEFGGELYSLGLRYEEQAEQLAKYTSVQSRNTLFSTLSYQEQSAAFKEYITDLNELASITGKSRQQLAEEMAQNNLRADANIRLQGATEEAQKMMTMAFKMGGEGSPLSNIMMAGAAGRSLAQEIAAGTPGIREFVAANPEAAEKLRTLADNMARGEIDQNGFMAGLKALGPGIENSAQELRGLFGISDIATVSVQAASDLQQFMNQLDTSIGKTGTAVDHVSKKASGAGGLFITTEAALTEVAKSIQEELNMAVSNLSKDILSDGKVGEAIQSVIDSMNLISTEFRIFAADPIDYMFGGVSEERRKEIIMGSHNKGNQDGGTKTATVTGGEGTGTHEAIMNDESVSAVDLNASLEKGEPVGTVKEAIAKETAIQKENEDSGATGELRDISVGEIENVIAQMKRFKTYNNSNSLGMTGGDLGHHMADLYSQNTNPKAVEAYTKYMAQLREIFGPAIDYNASGKNPHSFPGTHGGGSNELMSKLGWVSKFNMLLGANGVPDAQYLKQYGGGVGFGNPYIVGERGAELFTPGTSGTITPNNELATAKDSLAIANKLDQLNSTMKLVASNTNNAASTEAMNEQISTLRSLLGEAKRTYRVSRDLRDSNYS